MLNKEDERIKYIQRDGAEERERVKHEDKMKVGKKDR